MQAIKRIKEEKLTESSQKKEKVRQEKGAQ